MDVAASSVVGSQQLSVADRSSQWTQDDDHLAQHRRRHRRPEMRVSTFGKVDFWAG